MKRKIAVVGLGYVGLPVAVAFGKSHQVIGFDINAKRIKELKSGHDCTDEVTSQELLQTDIQFTDDLKETLHKSTQLQLKPATWLIKYKA